MFDSQQMFKGQLIERGIRDNRVLEAMARVPRHRFVPPELRSMAYEDHPLPIGEGQTISQPYMVASMTELLKLKGKEKVLEVGTGSGYQAAILAELAEKVYTIETVEKLAVKAREVLDSLGYSSVFIKVDDGYLGWEEEAPFDAIIVTCAYSEIPPPLIAQLKEGGRMVIPVDKYLPWQQLVLIEKKNGRPVSKELFTCVFVPLVRRQAINKLYLPPKLKA